MDKVRFGVLGTGIINRDFHLPVLADHPRGEVVALGNWRAASLEPLASQFGIRRTYTDFARMAADPDIDAVIIGLPNYLHAPVTNEMLKAGKHVLCEKPMAMNAAEAQTMIHAADKADRVLMIAHMWRYDREVRWLRDVVQSGVLGDIVKVKSQAVWTSAGPPEGGWFVTPEYAGGGALADMGVHSLDTISFLFGDQAQATQVHAHMGTFHRPIALEDTANLLIDYNNGVSALVEAGWYHHFADGPEGAVQVFGTQGYARTFPTELHCQIGGAWGVYRPAMPPRKQQCDLPMYVDQMDHFIDCVLGKKSPEPDGRIGQRAMAILDAAYQSAREKRSIDVSTYD